MSVQINGLEGLGQELEDLVERIEQAGGEVPMDELFTEDFMQSYTEFRSLEEFFAESPWRVESGSDFEDIPVDEFDSYVDEHTDFDSWDAMLQAGGREYFLREAAID
jgi:hypothetical protein